MTLLTPKMVAYLASEESLVREMYLDSEGVATWSIGLTNAAGVDVQQYKDKPAPLDICIKAAIDRIKAKYLPLVNRAFPTFDLNEGQAAAALSFAWRNGTMKAQWVRDFTAGMKTLAQQEWLNWTNHGTEVARAVRERDLFFNGKWPDLRCNVIPVKKPSYKPDFAHATRTDVLPILQQILGGN